jgi:2-succinyl-6-hydroxy-2,4-cyclohexadiene-1-carboxylate synthase
LLSGHGRDPVLARSWHDEVGRLLELLRRERVERAHLIGYSLGGRVALHVALRHPARVRRLVLESTSPGIADADERAARTAADAALADAIERDGVPAFVDRWMAQPLFRTQARLDGDVRARERARRLACSAEGLAAALRTMGVATQGDLSARLADLVAPVLLVAGAGDDRYRAHAAAMAARLPDARVVVVPDAGHTVHLERPAAWLATVVGFLAGDARAATAAIERSQTP